MSEEGTGNQTTDGDLLPDLNLKSAASSIEEARARLELRQSVGRDLRGAIKHILEAQEKLEGRGTVAELRLDLLEAIRLIGAVESLLKSSESEAGSEGPSRTISRRGSPLRAGSRFDSPHPDPRVEVKPGRMRDVPAILEPGTPVESQSPRQSLSALGAVALPGRGAGPDVSARRGVPPPPEPAPSQVAGSDFFTRVPEHEDGVAADSLNRRAFDRLVATYPIQLQPPYNGFSNSDLTQLPISGITLNLSKGGMLAQIEQGILRHGRYLIRFLGAGQNVRPEIMWGRVRRSRAADTGWEVGIEFDSPLEILRP